MTAENEWDFCKKNEPLNRALCGDIAKRRSNSVLFFSLTYVLNSVKAEAVFAARIFLLNTLLIYQLVIARETS